MQNNEQIPVNSLISELESEIKNPPEQKKVEDLNEIIKDLIIQRNELSVFRIIKKARIVKEINDKKAEIENIEKELKANICRKQRLIIKLKVKNGDLKKYDTIIFGKYHGNIEWLILAIEKDKVLLLTKYIIDGMPYHYSKDTASWANSSVRNWLNSQFLNIAFTKDEQKGIIISSVSPDRNFCISENSASLISNTPQGGFTQDKIFLLSLLEVQKLFDNSIELYTTKTPYAEQKVPENKANIWWLRTVHKFFMGKYFLGYNATAVHGTEGVVSDIGFNVDMNMIGVRPAMWLNLGE